jgi:hypothetical protein
VRSRDMIAKLNRLPTRADEVKVPDFSLLSPADQDRALELLHRLGSSDDGGENFEDERQEFWALVEGLPWLGSDDPDQGAIIAVPYDLESYWIWSQKASEWRNYNFSKLGKVQTLRFVELCREYGYEDGAAGLSRGDRTRQVKEQMVPLAAWDAKDRKEMAGLLDIAANETKTPAIGTRTLNKRGNHGAA